MAVIWDERLITRERAANMCGTWALKVDNSDYDVVFLRCAQCDGNVTRLPASGKIADIDGLISAVVRHMTINHGYSLSGTGVSDG